MVSTQRILGSRLHTTQSVDAARQGQWEKAEEAWTEGLKADWLSVALWNNSAVAKMRLGRFEEALSNLEKAHSLDVSHHPVYCTMSHCLLSMDSKDEAKKWLSQALKMQANSKPALTALDRLSSDNGSDANSEVLLWSLLVNEMNEPPWGSIQPDEPPPDYDDDQDDGGTRVPRGPVPPVRSASEKRTRKPS